MVATFEEDFNADTEQPPVVGSMPKPRLPKKKTESVAAPTTPMAYNVPLFDTMISDVDKDKNTSNMDKDKNTSNIPSFSGNELDAWFGLSDSTPNIEASLGKLVLNDEIIPEKEDSRRNPLVFRNPVDDSSESERETKKTEKTEKTEKAEKAEKTEKKTMDNETKIEKKTEKTAEKKQKKIPRKGKKKETTMAVDQSTTDVGDYEPL